MKATFHGDRLLVVEGTPNEIHVFKDLLEWGPKLPKTTGVPYKPTWWTTTGIDRTAPITSGDPPGSVIHPDTISKYGNQTSDNGSIPMKYYRVGGGYD